MRRRVQDLRPALRGLVREARRWGLPGGLAAVLLLVALVLVAVVLPRQRAAQAQGERALLAAPQRATAARARQAEAEPVQDPRERFLAAFPPEDERHRRVTNLLSLAAGMGLQPRRSELRAVPESELGLARVRVVLPLTGPYLPLRRFVEQALRDDPALSLDLLRLERSEAEATELRAELQWSLWMRAADAAAGRRAP